jgi:ATP-dependent DNA helicase RecG
MIHYIDVKDYLSQGEDIVREFKPNYQNHVDKIGSTMVAYANDLCWVGGGYIFIGIDNSGKPIGFQETFDEMQQKIADLCREQISPPLAPFIRKIAFDKHDVCEIKIVRSINRPHRFRNISYVRIGSTTRRATLDEENQIRQCSVIPTYDHQPVANSSPDDIDLIAFRDFLTSTKSSDILETDSDLSVIATNLGYVVQSGNRRLPRVGTILLFGKSPTRFFSHSKIQAIRFKGMDLTAPIASRQLFEGTLPDLIMSARRFIENLSGTFSVFPTSAENRIDYLEYPHWAVREAIANAVVHRDYAISGREIDIRVFDDRIEVISPGGLGGGLTLEDLGTGKRFIRNQLIADVLNDMKFIERAGTGILRMRKEMEVNGSPQPIFKSDQNTFQAILPAHPFYSSQRLLEEANQEKARANYPSAKMLYEKALAMNSSNYFAIMGLADLEMQIGNRDKSRELYKKAIDLQPKNPHAWLSLAILEEKLANVQAAREVYKAASKVVTKSGVVYRNWAVLEWNQKHYKEADSLFENALHKDPADHITWYKRGQMNINSPVEKVKRQGEAHLRKALNLTEDTYTLSDIYFLLAREMPELRYNPSEIEDTYKRSLDLNPGRATVHYHFGKYLESIGKKKEANIHLQKARELGYIPKRKHWVA